MSSSQMLCARHCWKCLFARGNKLWNICISSSMSCRFLVSKSEISVSKSEYLLYILYWAICQTLRNNQTSQVTQIVSTTTLKFRFSHYLSKECYRANSRSTKRKRRVRWWGSKVPTKLIVYEAIILKIIVMV